MLVEGDVAAVERALAREVELWEAYKARDVAALERLIDPHALDVGPWGALARDEVMAAVGQMEIAFYALDRMYVRVGSDVEVVTYRATTDGTHRGAPFASREVWASSVWGRRGEEWVLVHRQESPAR